MLLGERYRLEVRWSRVVYEKEGEATLEGCYFSGPVLKEVAQIEQQDHMDLDFVNQYRVFVNQFYIARLSWNGVKQTLGKIYLRDVTFTNRHVNSVPKLNDDDYILINTANHEEEKHQYNLVYPSYLLRQDGELYNFKG